MAELTEMEQEAIRSARNLLESYGFVILRVRSHQLAQQRLAVALSEKEFEIRERGICTRWALGIARENRQLRDRISWLCSTARAAGCSEHDLAGPHTEVLDRLDEIDVDDTAEVSS